MYYRLGWDGEWSHYEESRYFAETRKQDMRIAEREADIEGDNKEEIWSFWMEPKVSEKTVSEKTVSAGYARDDDASSDDAGQNIV